MMSISVFIILFCLVFPIFGFAQESQKNAESEQSAKIFDFQNNDDEQNIQYPYEYYRMLGEARNFFFEKKYYEALGIYEEIQDKFGKTLVITIALGELFFRLGDQKSALNFFLRAENDTLFYDNVLWSTVYYRLAILYYNLNAEEKFVLYLEKIIERDLEKDEAITSIAVLQGVDGMLALFNLVPNYAYEAYRELGLYYMTHKNEKKGAFYSFTALAMAVHWGISDVIQNSKIKFEFTDLQYFSETIRGIKDGRIFLEEIHIDRILYSLKTYFTSDSYIRTRINRRDIVLQKEYIQNTLIFVSPNSLLTYTDSFLYYPVIRL